MEKLFLLLRVFGLRFWDACVTILRGLLILLVAYYVTIFLGWCFNSCFHFSSEDEGHFMMGIIIDLFLFVGYLIGVFSRRK